MKSLTHYSYEKYWNNRQVKTFERININKTLPCIILKWIIFQANEKKKRVFLIFQTEKYLLQQFFNVTFANTKKFFVKIVEIPCSWVYKHTTMNFSRLSSHAPVKFDDSVARKISDRCRNTPLYSHSLKIRSLNVPRGYGNIQISRVHH